MAKMLRAPVTGGLRTGCMGSETDHHLSEDTMQPTFTVLDELTADLFDLDARTVAGDLLVVDSITDNGCGTLPACNYPDPQS